MSQDKAKHTARRRGKSRNSVRVLYRRANRWQRAVAVFCGLLVLHGLWVLFVPGVQPEADGLPCPPAVVAAVTGSGGFQLTDVSPAMAAYHDAACAAAGRWWLATGVLQIGVAAAWGLATLEWARLRRRARRRERRNEAEATSQEA
ncbi:MAG TPA: hypothetical protein VM287_13450 [Egibacteraceae bacterium]|nr:hypothetical protein [Egibacteraceae bacterium]